VRGPEGSRQIAFCDFHRLPGDSPHIDNTLAHEEVVVSVNVLKPEFGRHYTYVKLRDRQSYAFALVSTAIGLKIEDGRIARASVAMGGVAHKPWRDRAAERGLIGQLATAAAFTAFADTFLADAVGQGDNDFKIPLARRLLVRALVQAAEGRPQDQTRKSIN
jgi:xanthine dehydrogenase YagS FAD-binding subunit